METFLYSHKSRSSFSTNQTILKAVNRGQNLDWFTETYAENDHDSKQIHWICSSPFVSPQTTLICFCLHISTVSLSAQIPIRLKYKEQNNVGQVELTCVYFEKAHINVIYFAPPFPCTQLCYAEEDSGQDLLTEWETTWAGMEESTESLKKKKVVAVVGGGLVRQSESKYPLFCLSFILTVPEQHLKVTQCFNAPNSLHCAPNSPNLFKSTVVVAC